MKQDPVVLIIDGGEGTYQSFIEAVNEIGEEYKKRIYEELLKIEPPEKELDFTI